MNKFTHQASIVYLALILLIRMMAMPISLLDYSINKSFISSHLCEYRLKPAMHCAGKCYLNKQLAKANDSQESRDQRGAIKNLIMDFFESPEEPAFGRMDVYSIGTNHFQAPPVSNQYAANIFHPPIA